MVAQGRRSHEIIVFVGPSETTTKAFPQTPDHEALTEDGRAGEHVNHKGFPQHTHCAHDGTTQGVPQTPRAARVDVFRFGKRHGD